MELNSYLAKLQLLPCRCAGCLQHPSIQTYQLQEQAHHVSAQYFHNQRNSKKMNDAIQIRLYDSNIILYHLLARDWTGSCWRNTRKQRRWHKGRIPGAMNYLWGWLPGVVADKTLGHSNSHSSGGYSAPSPQPMCLLHHELWSLPIWSDLLQIPASNRISIVSHNRPKLNNNSSPLILG